MSSFNMKYIGEFSPIVLDDFKKNNGTGLVVYQGQVITVSQEYVGKLPSDSFVVTEEQETSLEEVKNLAATEINPDEKIKINIYEMQKILEESEKRVATLEKENEELRKAQKAEKKGKK